jgi:AraC-like DNA-binding protein
VFYSYLYSFLLILLVPVVMSFFVFANANDVVNEESAQTHDALLRQTAAYLDMVVSDVHQLSYLVSYNQRLTTLLYDSVPLTGDQYYLAYQLAQEFQDFRDSTSGAVDFYVYLPNLEMVISPDGYFSTRNFHIARRSAQNEPFAEWLANLSSVDRVTFRPNRIALTPHQNSSAPVPTIEFISPLPAAQPTTRPRGWAVIQIDQRLLQQPVRGTSWADDSVFLLYHREHGLISSSDPQVTLEQLRADGVDPEALGNREEITILDRPHYAFTQPSQLPNWHANARYTLLIPRNLFADRFSDLRRFTLAAFAIVTILGVVVIYWLALVRYRPIHNLLSLLQPDADGSFTLRSDEFEMIRSSLQATLSEDRSLRQELTESRPLLLQRYLQQLLKGSIEDNEQAREVLEHQGVTFAHPRMTLVLFEPDLDERSAYPRIVTSLESLVVAWSGVTAIVVRDIDRAIGVIVSHRTGPLAGLMEDIVFAKHKLERQHEVSCAVGISNSHPRSDGFAILLNEARAALSYRLVKGGREPIPFSDVLTSGRTYYYPIDEEQKLINSITTGSYAAASGILHEVFAANFDEVKLSVEMARCLMFDLISTMIKTLNAIPSVESDAQFWSSVKPIIRLTRCHSLEELRAEMDDILRRVCEHVRSGRSTHAELLRKQILELIRSHLHDRNLGPEMVASVLGKNSAYVARFFREEMGIGMSSYIKQLRVSEAKRLLAETDLTIRETAEQVGFSDSNALIRAFKSCEGVTPGEYRDCPECCRANSAPGATDLRN